MTTVEYVVRPSLSRYGDTWVTPAELFDVSDPAAGPPPDAVDVQFRCPLSLSVLLDALSADARSGDEAGAAESLAAFARGFSELTRDTVTRLQRDAGYVVDGDRGGSAAARLELAAVAEPRVPGINGARWHVHIYVGPTAVSLFDDTRWPIDPEHLRQAVFDLTQGFFTRGLRELAERELGAVWGEPRPGAVLEIVDPPWHERVTHPDRGVCPGPWGPRSELLLADERRLKMAVETERQIAWEYENGLAGGPRPTAEDWKEFWDDFFRPSLESGLSPQWAQIRAEEAAAESVGQEPKQDSDQSPRS